jgi:NAD(P)-dependent dehydrogenase (short-subunit alcohol dehydrogenase family)
LRGVDPVLDPLAQFRVLEALTLADPRLRAGRCRAKPVECNVQPEREDHVESIDGAAVPAIRRAGGVALVGIISAVGLKGSGNMAAYTATKSAVMPLMRNLADEVRTYGIWVNAVLPSTIATPAKSGADTSRWVQPTEVVKVMAVSLFDRASGVTGALLPVG